MADTTPITREPVHGQSHPPARDDAGPAEPREETVARAVEQSRQAHVDQDVPADVGTDPSTRRGMNPALAKAAGIGFVLGAAVGAAIGALLRVAPAALGDLGEMPGIIFMMAGALGVIGALAGAYFVLEREDGRIERDVEGELGHQPAPGEGLDPKHDG